MKGTTASKPKCLTELAGRTLLDWQRSALTAGGVSVHGIVTGYLSKMLDDPTLTAFYNPRWQTTNMVRSLLCAASWLSNEACIISYSDIFYPAETVRRLAAAHGDLVMAYDPEWQVLWQARFPDPLSDAETLRLHVDGSVTAIGARATSLDEIQGQYMGLLKFTPSGFHRVRTLVESLPANIVDRLDMTTLLSLLLDQEARIDAVPTAPHWGEVDSEADLELYHKWIQQGRLTLL